MPKRSAIAAVLALSAPAALGQAGPGPSDPLYQVEIIIFEILTGDRFEEDFFHGQDDPRHEPLPPRFSLPGIELESVAGFDPRGGSRAQDEPPGAVPGDVSGDSALPTDGLELIELQRELAPGRSAGAGADEALPAGFRILGRDELKLSGDARALRNSRDFRVLAHVGWEQVGVAGNLAPRLDVSRLGITNPAGTIQPYVDRFRHVAVDLEFFDGAGTFWAGPPGPRLAPLEYARRYRLLQTEQNPIRGDEVHHIDHPLFGVIVRMEPAPEPEEPEDAAAAEGPVE